MKRGDKIICIKGIDKIYELNKTYEITAILTNHIFVEYLKTEYAFGIDDNYDGLRFKEHFMPYNEWLSLERERKINSILDEE